MEKLSLYEKIPALENNFTVKFRVYSGDKDLIPHWHEHIEILYFTRGVCDFICNGKQFEATVGDLVVVNSTEIHSFETSGETEYYCILIYPEFFSDIKRIELPIRNRVRGDGTVDEIMRRLYAEHKGQAIGSDMATKGMLYTLLAHLYREYPYDEAHPIDRRQRASMLERLDRVITFITENYAERITTQMLADMCYLTEAHFCRFFKKAVGKTVTKYINEYRVGKAAVLLRNTDSPVGEIAEAVGFDDLNYFSRVFRAQTGMSPTAYRREKL